MPVLKKRFAERNVPLIGVLGVVGVALIVVTALSAATIKSALTQSTYHARFAEAAGIRAGDDVRVSGLSVGKVREVTLRDNQVDVAFFLDDSVRLGGQTSVEIKSSTVLGRKYLDVGPAGDGHLDDGATIPLEHTRTAFDVQSRLEGLATEVAPLDKEQLAGAIDTVTQTLHETPEEVRVVLDGVRRASRVITARDSALLDLLDSAAQVSGVLADRSSELTVLVRDANLLLAELTARRQALHALLVNVDALFAQLKGLALDNRATLGPALAQLDQVSELLKRNRDNITAAVEGLGNYVGSLGEAVNAGPWFYGYIANLLPSNMAQQTVQSLLQQAPSQGVTP